MKRTAAKFISFIALALLISGSLTAQVKVTQGSDRIMVEINGAPFTDVFYGGSAVKPYMHPLRSASGKIVTRRYPMEIFEGESRDHPHHRGLSFTHGDVNGYDFWSADPSRREGKFGTIRIKKVVGMESKKKEGSLRALFEWIAADQVLLTEHRTVTFYAEPNTRTFDLDINLIAVQQVTFGDTKEGTFAIRVASELEEPTPRSPAKPPRGGRMVSATGKVGEKEIWGSRAPWVTYSGVIDGETLGITIMDHPMSPRHPTYWHARGYGLFAANIFGVRDFLRDKTQDGKLVLQPGENLRFRYRVIIHPGDSVAAGIPALYERYAKMKFK